MGLHFVNQRSKQNLTTTSLGLKYVKVYDSTAEEMCTRSYCEVPTRFRPTNDTSHRSAL